MITMCPENGFGLIVPDPNQPGPQWFEMNAAHNLKQIWIGPVSPAEVLSAFGYDVDSGGILRQAD
jgi:hypothetical protein